MGFIVVDSKCQLAPCEQASYVRPYFVNYWQFFFQDCPLLLAKKNGLSYIFSSSVGFLNCIRISVM
jgi:hypothetical protein